MNDYIVKLALKYKEQRDGNEDALSKGFHDAVSEYRTKKANFEKKSSVFVPAAATAGIVGLLGAGYKGLKHVKKYGPNFFRKMTGNASGAAKNVMSKADSALAKATGKANAAKAAYKARMAVEHPGVVGKIDKLKGQKENLKRILREKNVAERARKAGQWTDKEKALGGAAAGLGIYGYAKKDSEEKRRPRPFGRW